MKLQVASFPLTALVLACASAGVGVESAGVPFSLLRGGQMPVSPLRRQPIHVKDMHRRLDEDNDKGGNDDEVEEQQEEEDSSNSSNDEDDWEGGYAYADEEDMTNTTTYNNKVEAYEAQAMLLFETAPAKWNAGQWVMFAVFGGVLASFIVFSIYCCIKKRRRSRKRAEYDDDDYLLERSNSGLLTRTICPRSISQRKWFRKY